jgi:hypothetical protein
MQNAADLSAHDVSRLVKSNMEIGAWKEIFLVLQTESSAS